MNWRGTRLRNEHTNTRHEISSAVRQGLLMSRQYRWLEHTVAYIVPHWARISTQRTGLVLILSHSLRYTGYETMRRQANASTKCLETEIIQIAGLTSISIAPAPTFMPITPSNAPPTSLLWFHQMCEGGTLRKMDRSCIWEQSNVAQSIAVVAIVWWKYWPKTSNKERNHR